MTQLNPTTGPTAQPDETTKNKGVNPEPAPASTTGYEKSAETIRSTAKWLVTAFAGVGGILVAGIPLTELGDLRGIKLVQAVVAIFVALLAVGYIIPKVARVFTAKYITMADLVNEGFPEGTGRLATMQLERRYTPIMEAIEQSGDELFGADAADVGELNERLNAVNTKLREQPEPPSEDLAKRASLMSATERVVAFANYEDVRRTFKRTYKPMAVAALIVALSVVAFAYLAGSARTAVNVISPSPVLLSLNPGVREKLLGSDCNLSQVHAVAISGNFSEPLVVTTGDDGRCKVTQFEMNPKLGFAVPVVGIPTPSNGAARTSGMPRP
jgi:hypothetical protein